MLRTKFVGKKKKRISTSAAKQKGRLLQQWAAEKISDLTGIPWGPGDDSLISSRPMAQKGVDVILRGKALKLAPFSIECKRQESWSVQAWIKQAKENQIPNTDWALIIRKNKMEPVIVMDAEAFFRILNDAKTKKEGRSC
jgi:hypothetical protein